MSTTDRIHPSHISIPLPISCNPCNDSPPLIFYSAPSSPFDEDDIPFYTPPIIPDDIFYFPQPSISSSSVPLPPPISQPPSILIHVPSSPPSVDARHLSSSTDDTFPTVPIPLPDFALDDEGLTTLEKLYLFSYSEAVFHRIFIVHAMPCFLSELTPAEAVTYVLPLLSGLAVDQGPSTPLILL
jgi:serine/threonine-protein phosphatase 4 regulatory subunit 1